MIVRIALISFIGSGMMISRSSGMSLEQMYIEQRITQISTEKTCSQYEIHLINQQQPEPEDVLISSE